MDILFDINFLRALSTLLLFVAFVTICVAVFSGKRKTYYEQAAMLPFADESEEPAEDFANTSNERSEVPQ